MDVQLTELRGGGWEARIAVATPEGARYFCERGQNRTAALLSLRQALGRYHGDTYLRARELVLDQALA